jgi:hypothetical protein
LRNPRNHDVRQECLHPDSRPSGMNRNSDCLDTVPMPTEIQHGERKHIFSGVRLACGAFSFGLIQHSVAVLRRVRRRFRPAPVSPKPRWLLIVSAVSMAIARSNTRLSPPCSSPTCSANSVLNAVAVPRCPQVVSISASFAAILWLIAVVDLVGCFAVDVCGVGGY